MSDKEFLIFETINDLLKYIQTVAALLDGFVLIIYANYYILMEISRAIIHIHY